MSTFDRIQNLPAEPAAWQRLLPADLGGTLRLAGLLGLILAAQLVFKTTLESSKVMVSLPVPAEYFHKPLTLLFPITIPGGYVRWSATGLVVTTVLDQLTSPETTIYLLSSLLTVTAFIASWLALRSLVFTLTLTLAMAFAPLFNYAWVNGSCSVYYLFVTYALINLSCLYRLLTDSTSPTIGLRRTFAISLVVLVLSWDTSLDYMVFLAAISTGGYLYCRRHRFTERLPAIRFIAITTAAVGLPYLITRLAYGGNHNSPGSECELIFCHPHKIMMLEDFISNVITYLYIAFAVFIPKWLVASNSLSMYGEQAMIDAQNGYHAACQQFVPMHYHFFWHFQAGMVFLAFFYCGWKLLVKCYQRPSSESLVLLGLMLLIAAGFATHSLIKFRPYLSVPVLVYKATISAIGVALLLSFVVKGAWERRPSGSKRIAIVGLAWSTILVCGLTHPAWQADWLSKVGCSGPPDPLRHFDKMPKP